MANQLKARVYNGSKGVIQGIGLDGGRKAEEPAPVYTGIAEVHLQFQP